MPNRNDPRNPVRPLILLDAVANLPSPPKRLEPERCRNVSQNRRRKGSTKPAQEMVLVDVDAGR
jgi:hypothetical protein